MIINDGLPLIKSYVNAITQLLKDHGAGREMSALQCYWLSFVILDLLVTNYLCWSRSERFGLNEYKASAICWIFKKAKIAWDFLLYASVLKIIESYNIHYGVLVIDDCSAKFKLKSHDKKLYVIALKYGDESDYLIANDTTWLNIDVISLCTTLACRSFYSRLEVLEGWNQLAMQRGDVSDKLIISLLRDHMLHFHKDQLCFV